MRKFSFFVAIFFIALAGNITAQTNYGIEIAGVMVTSANCDSITGGGIISGSVSYKHETKTLTLKNATIEGNIWFGSGDSGLENITITLIGENSVTYGSIGSVTNTKTINGSGSLKTELISSEEEQNTIIEDCTIDINNDDWVMFSTDSKLTIKNANLSSEGTVAIGDFADIELIGCKIVEPVNAQIIDKEFDGDYPGKYICNEDSTIATKVVIKRISTTDYGIQVAGVKVTSENCNNITGANISGSVYYTPETKTLTLNNATIEGYIGFNDEVEDITITLVGENTVTQYLKTVKGTKRINGTGSLKAVGIWGAGEQNTIIEDCTIDIITALSIAIAGNSKLTIKNADISAEGDVAIGDFADIELVDCEIVEPVNAQIIDTNYNGDYAGKYICDADGNIAKKVVIKKSTSISYGIRIAGVQVTSANCNSITGAKISGSVSYNHESKILTLDNATIDGDIGFGADSSMIEDITITLVGHNAVDAIGSVSGTKTINGGGSLKANFISCTSEQNTIIDDCTIGLYNSSSWILYSDNDGSNLTIRNANLSAEGTVAIGDFASIELVGCEIVEPINAQIIDKEVEEDGFTYAGKYVCDADGNVAKKVVITKLSGLNDIVQSSINIYPNPAHDFVTIEGKGEVTITNSLGQVVKEIKDNSTYRTLNIKDFERGVYYIKVGDTTQKLVIE